jgi:hypothetical protein
MKEHTMQTLLKIGVGMLVLAALLVGTSFSVLRAQDVGNNGININNAGSRAMKGESRTIGANVVAISLNGPIDLMLKQGVTASMSVYGEERLLSRVKTTQDGNNLVIDTTDSNFHLYRPLRVDITLPALQQLAVHGSGDSVVSGFNGDKLILSMHGSGDIRFNGEYQHVNASVLGSGDLELALGNSSDLDVSMLGSGNITTSGKSKSLTAHMMGSGSLGAEKLLADAVKIDAMGSGDSSVFASQTAILDVKGSGDVEVHGNPPHREVNRAGSGDISWDSK